MTKLARWNDGSVGEVEVDASVVGDQVKRRLLQQAVRMYEANRRQGTVKTKTRGETAYTTRKPYKQKGTGRARRGDFNSPLLRGGGVVFGPRPRDYSYAMPRKALREALRSALRGKLDDGEVHALSSTAFAKPSTKTAAAALGALGCAASVCIVTPQQNEMVYLSFRNIPRVAVVRAADLNAYDVLRHRRLVLVDDAWDVITARLSTFKRDGGEAS